MDARYGNYLEEKIADQGVKDHVVLQIADERRVPRRRIIEQNNVEDVENNVANSFEPSPCTEQVNTSTSRHVNRVANILIVLSLVLEIASTVMDLLASPRRPLFALISLLMTSISAFLSTGEFIYKIRAHKARFLCKRPVPWFYYPSRGYNRIFGRFDETVLLFCVLAHFIPSAINYSFIHRGRKAPIKISLWALFFAFGKFFTMAYVEREKIYTKLTQVGYAKPAKERELDPAEEIEMKPAKERDPDEEIETKPAKEREPDPAEEIEMNPAEEIETDRAEENETKPAKEIERDGLDDDMDQWGNQKSREK